MKRAGRLIAALAPTVAMGCTTLTGEYDNVPIQERFTVPADATAACIAAAKRASRWCISGTSISSDGLYAQNCNEAQWAYARQCR